MKGTTQTIMFTNENFKHVDKRSYKQKFVRVWFTQGKKWVKMLREEAIKRNLKYEELEM